jgi:hypothetical protein
MNIDAIRRLMEILVSVLLFSTSFFFSFFLSLVFHFRVMPAGFHIRKAAVFPLRLKPGIGLFFSRSFFKHKNKAHGKQGSLCEYWYWITIFSSVFSF